VSRILVTGGSGFVGTNIQRVLRDRELRLLVRDPSSLEPGDSVEVVKGDVTDPDSLTRATAGCETVIHLVAIIEESSGATFDRIIRQGTENVVGAAKSAGVRRFVHMSALGAQANPAFPYLNAKWGAEESVRGSGLDWTIFRPSVIFGPGDGFINVLANLIRKAPVTPVVGDGHSKFQPVAVGEVAEAFRRAVDDAATIGQVYELGGGETYTYEQMLDLLAEKLGKRRPKLHMPVRLMKAVVALSAPLPKRLRPPVTKEQLNMLALDNCTGQSRTAELIGREPTSLRDGIDYITES
jgi:NADH dehydrogenase